MQDQIIKVKVVKPLYDSYWYSKHVGEIFEVVALGFGVGGFDYKVVNDNNRTCHYIRKVDCEVVNNLQEELEAVKKRVAEIEKQLAEEAAIEAAKPFTKEQYEKVVAQYRACAGRKKFEQGKRNYCVTCMSGRVSVDYYDTTSSASLFGAWFDNHFTCHAALSDVGIENIKKAHEYEMNIGLPNA